MSKIRLLSQNLINQIAAGEVVERPASAVKELVENAIDAGASHIQIDVAEGGKDLIIVTDNGCGMEKEDLLLAIERHATSKLHEDDLMSIKTMGFRGEALPSLGAIARLSISSRTKDQDHAWKLVVEGGIKSDPIPASHPQGTRIEVKDLFYATPARLKFLKTATTELNHITEIIEKLALANPSIHFTLRDQKRSIFDFVKADSLLERLVQIYGKAFKENTVFVEGEREGYKIEGFVGLPTYHRNAANYQHFFVNQRAVKDKILTHALRLAYQDLLAKDRYPIAFLYLTIPLREVDVNVHPAKSEVRFLDQGLVRGLIVSSLRASLQSQSQNTAPVISEFALSKFTPSQHMPSPKQNTPSFAKSFTSPKANIQESFKLNSFKSPEHKQSIEQDHEIIAFQKPVDVISETEPKRFLGRPLAQLHLNYILSQTENGFILIDQHAAAERISYEKLKKSLLGGPLPRQALLIPEVIDLKASEKEALLEHAQELQKFGLFWEVFGEGAIIIRETPALLGESNIKQLIRDLLDELLEEKDSTLLQETLCEILSSYACHHSVRAGQKLSIPEMDALLRDMEKTEFSGQCNHGRPTYIELKLKDIEILFGRQ